MGLRGGHGLTTSSGGAVYWQKIMALFGSAVVAYWPQEELSGAEARDASGNARHGAYTGVDLANAAGPKGGMAPLYDGANDYTNVYSAGLAGAFNVAAGSLLAWAQVSAAGIWTDGQARCVMKIGSANHYVHIVRSTTNGQMSLVHRVGATIRIAAITGLNETGWLHFGLTWSQAADELIAYKDGAAFGAPTAGLGVFSDLLVNGQCNIGANTTTPTSVWSGWLAHVLVLNRAATPDEMAAVYAWT